MMLEIKNKKYYLFILSKCLKFLKKPKKTRKKTDIAEFENKNLIKNLSIL